LCYYILIGDLYVFAKIGFWRKMKIVAFSKNRAPGILVFVDNEGKEDAVLVSPGTPVTLESVRKVVRHDPHIAYSVMESDEDVEGHHTLVKRKKEPSQ
jgi:hypothetical protein